MSADTVFGIALYVGLLVFYWRNEPRARRNDAKRFRRHHTPHKPHK